MPSPSLLSLNSIPEEILEPPSYSQSVLETNETSAPEYIEWLYTALASLPAIKQEAVRMHYGLGGEPRHTLREIGVRLGISKQRVSQILKEVPRQLRLKLP